MVGHVWDRVLSKSHPCPARGGRACGKRSPRPSGLPRAPGRLGRAPGGQREAPPYAASGRSAAGGMAVRSPHGPAPAPEAARGAELSNLQKVRIRTTPGLRKGRAASEVLRKGATTRREGGTTNFGAAVPLRLKPRRRGMSTRAVASAAAMRANQRGKLARYRKRVDT